MRVTFAQQYRQSLDNMQQAAQRLADYQRQVSSGKRLERISDDPAAAAGAVSERNGLAQIDQYTQSNDSAYSRLTVVDTVMSDIITKLTAAQVSAASAAGTNASAAQRTAAAQQLSGLKDALLDDFNTSFQGNYVFSGTASTTKPYVTGAGGTVNPYAGSNTEVFVDVAHGRAVPIGMDGSALTQGSASTDLFTTMDNLISAINAGDNDGISKYTAEVNDAFARVTTAQSRVGTAMNTLESEQQQMTTAKLASTKRLSQLEDANMVDAISGMQEADTAYKASLAASANTSKLSLMDYL
jgi:flagellar hook-associated protein 3 FlgL